MPVIILMIKQIRLCYAVVLFCKITVWLQTELDPTKSYYHFFNYYQFPSGAKVSGVGG